MTDAYPTIDGEIIDSRDLIDWLENWCDEEDDEDRERAEEIRAMEDSAEDWLYGAAFIREDYFTQYAKELAEHIGAIDPDASWPLSCIDWEAAADALKMNYTTAEYQGHTYYVR